VCWNSKRQFPFYICRPRKTNWHFPYIGIYRTVCIKTAVFIYNIYIWRHIYIYIYTHNIYTHILRISIYLYVFMLLFQTETEVQAIFLNPFTICSSCKRKFVVCPNSWLRSCLHNTAQYIIIRSVTPRGPVKVHSNKSNRVTPSGPCDSSPPQG
jgi:hypothetical protein